MNPSSGRSPWPTDKGVYVAYALVESIAGQLRMLKSEVERVHAQAMQPDEITVQCLAVADLLKLSDLALPTVAWPKWSSLGSKNPKSEWRGDMFAEPSLSEPER